MVKHAAYEGKQRGSNNFPLEYYYVDFLHPRYDMPFHWHMECELISVLRGVFTLSIDGSVHELRPGSFAFVPGETIHGGVPCGFDSVYECIVLDLDYFCQALYIEQGVFATELNHGANIVRHFTREDAAGQLIEQLFMEGRGRSAGHEFLTAGLILGFVGAVIRGGFYGVPSEKQHKSAQQAKQIKRALTRIRKDFRLPLTLDELSAEATMAPNYFCRVFRDIVGRPPIDYLNYYRVERAAELIYTTNDILTDIALRCGFNDSCYFSRSFRKYKGMSPSEYRKQTHDALGRRHLRPG